MKTRFGPLAAAILSAALSVAPLPGQKPSGPAGTREALAALERMIGALGGRKVLESIKDITVTGTVEAPELGLTSSFVLYQKEPDKMRMDITVAEAAVTIVQAFDGRRGWGTDDQSLVPEPMDERGSRDMAHKALGNAAYLSPRALGITYALKPKETAGGKDLTVLEQTLADGHKVLFFLDPDTDLPYKVTTRTLGPSGAEAEAETYLSDYREFCGVLVATASRTLLDGKEVQRLFVAGVTCNSRLEDALFELRTK